MKDQTLEDNNSCEFAFDQFVAAVTCKSILNSFYQLKDLAGLQHVGHLQFYEQLKVKLKGSWKAQNLWSKLDKRAAHKDYKRRQACSKLKVLIIGAGPCGLRTAIECAFLGAKTVIAEKRDRFSRNNVLHLWPYLITDLRNLGAKKFFGKFCAGAIDHISIRQLQCILLKVALLLGVEVHVNVTYEELVEPPDDQSTDVGWKCKMTPENHVLSEYEFDVLIGADGKRNTLSGFKRKEFRGKLAIAITANFINGNTQADARVEEISGVAFIFNQKFFMVLKESTRIDLENIVYYKDDTHYFVMTAKKASLLEKGVLKEDFTDTVALLNRSNVNQDALMAYAREAAEFATNYQLPSLDYAVNHYGQADVAMFDFTSMFAAENASKFILKNGHHLLIGLVGDSLLEPFWPTGSGCARGFLSAFDAAWMIYNWAIGTTPLEVLAERESIYTILSQTTPSYLNKNYNMYSIDPKTRYPNLNLKAVMPSQVKHLFESDVFDTMASHKRDHVTVPIKKSKHADAGGMDSYNLLQWCQKIVNTGKYKGVHVVDFTTSWHNGLALCALIHSFRPEIIDYAQLLESDFAANNQLAFSVAEKELGIPPVMTGDDIARCVGPDKLTMISYLTQFYDLFRYEPVPYSFPHQVNAGHKIFAEDIQENYLKKSSNMRISFLQKLNSRQIKTKKRKEQEEIEGLSLMCKKLREKEEDKVELTHHNKTPVEEVASRVQQVNRKEIKVNKVRDMTGAVSVPAMADILVAKFRNHEGREIVKKLKNQQSFLAASAASEVCFFCKKRVYIMERMSAEGEFFHRGCLRCDHCGMGLRLTNYSCDKDIKPVKFYCCQHAVPEMRVCSNRKRVLVDVEKKNVPDVIITPLLGVDSEQVLTEKSMQKNMSVHQTHVLRLNSATERNKNMPERVGFEISFIGEEGSEEEQFAHNLQASFSISDAQLDDDSDSLSSRSDADYGNGDEVQENTVDLFKFSQPHLALEEACELRRRREKKHSKGKNTISDKLYLKSDTTGMLPIEFHDELKDNFESSVTENIREGKSGQSKNTTEDVDRIVKCLPQNSILKKSLNSLKATDFENGRGSDKECGRFAEFMKKNDRHDKISAREGLKKFFENTYDTCLPKNSVSESLFTELSDSDKNKIFIEGHLSPSASRTRRFRINRHSRHSKERRIPVSKIDDREARITRRSTSDTFQSDSVSTNLTSDVSGFPMQEKCNKIQSKSMVVRNNLKSELRDGIDNVLNHQSLRGTKNLKAGLEKNENFIQQVLETTTLSDNSDKSNQVFSSADKFVTDRHQNKQKQFNSVLWKQVQEKCSKSDTDDFLVDSSFSISTPSDSESSVSSIEFDNIRPIQEVMQDYSTTQSLVFGESYREKVVKKENMDMAFQKNTVVEKNRIFLEAAVENNSNCYVQEQNRVNDKSKLPYNKSLSVIPDSYLKKAASGSILTPVSLTQPLPPPISQVPFSQAHRIMKPSASVSAKSISCNTKASSGTFTPIYKVGEHLSSENDVFHYFFNNNFESHCVKKQPSIYSLSVTAEEIKAPTQLTISISEDSPKGTRSLFTSPSNSSTLVTNSKFSQSQQLDSSDLSILKKRQKYTSESSVHLPTMCFSSKVKPKNVTDSKIEEEFYPSLVPDNKRQPRFLPQSMACAEKTILSSSPTWKKPDLAILSTQQIRDICKAEMETARTQARIKAKLKTDEELGIIIEKPAHTSRTQTTKSHSSEKTDIHDNSEIILDKNDNKMTCATEDNHMLLPTSRISLKMNEPGMIVVNSPFSTSDTDRQLMVQPESHAEHSTVYNTSDINDMILDTQSNEVSSLQSTTSRATECNQPSQCIPIMVKKNKVKLSRTKSETKDKKSGNKAKKLKSFLALINLTKVPKKEFESDHVIMSPDCSPNKQGFISRIKSKDKAPKKKKTREKEIKPSKDKSNCQKNLGIATCSEYGKNLATCSVFHSDISKRDTKDFSGATNARKNVPFASKACFDEISGLNENHISFSPVWGRKNDNIEEQVARQLYKIDQKQQKQAEQKRFRMAQEIQRQLEEVEVRQRDLENMGIAIEKILRGNASDEDESHLMSEWFTLVHEKNTLLRYESELMVRAKELELEDRQARLETDFREKSKKSEDTKTESDLTAEKSLLEELLDVVDQRNYLVAMLEEDRLREQKEDVELKEIMAKKGYVLSPLSFDQRQ